MTKLVFSNIFRFVVLIILQILLLNYVSFGGYMIPFIYILAVLMLPTRLGCCSLLLLRVPLSTFSATSLASIRSAAP